MNVLVTGGAGFIGTRVVADLISAGHHVIILDNLSSGYAENINSNASFYELDIMDNNLSSLFESELPEIVIHLAAQTSVQYSMTDPLDDASTNILGTINILENCRKYKVKKVIFTSSAAVYGAPCFIPIHENHPTSPISNYGLSKQSAENYIRIYSGLYDMTYTILRLSNVYGIGQLNKCEGGVISIFLKNLMSGERCILYGKGENTRDFIYVQDVADAIIKAIQLSSNETINISSGLEVSISDLYYKISSLLKLHEEPIIKMPIEGDIKHSLLENSKATKLLEWKPKYSLEQGLEEIIHAMNPRKYKLLEGDIL